MATQYLSSTPAMFRQPDEKDNMLVALSAIVLTTWTYKWQALPEYKNLQGVKA